MYDTLTYVAPIQERARQEAYAICNYPSAEELSFARNLPSNSSPIDRQRANQVDARVHGCSATATMLENKSLSDNGRPLYVLELLANGMSGAALFGIGWLKFMNRKRTTQTAAT